MKTYLELEGRFGPKPRPQSQTQSTQNLPQQSQSRSVQPSTNPKVRKAPIPKTNDRRKSTVIAKRGYKVRVLDQPMPTTTAPTTATASTQMQITGSATTAILVTEYKLATGQFAEASSPTARSQNGGHPSVQNPPPLEYIPNAPVRQGTSLPSAGSTSENLFETRKDWLIPPTPVPTSAPTVKTESPPQVAAIPRAMVTPRQAAKNCTWGPPCPICEEDEEHEEDCNGNLQNPPRLLPQNAQQPQPQSFQHPQPQYPQPQNYNYN